MCIRIYEKSSINTHAVMLDEKNPLRAVNPTQRKRNVHNVPCIYI